VIVFIDMIIIALVTFLACMARVGEGLGVEVEDVTGRQLEAALETENLLAVMFYSKNCKTCDRVLSVLERVGEEVAVNGITLVRVNDKRAAKTHAIRNFPALSLFKTGEALHYEGDLTDADAILDFLSSPEALDVPGQIEDVTASQLEVLVQHQNFVAVFFYDPADTTSLNSLAALESIDDDLDEHNIPAVKMSDTVEARQYGVKTFPSIIVFVKKIPELYQGDVTDEAAVLGWALTQAGIKVAADVEEEKDDGNDILSFPTANAEDSVPAAPKVTPKSAKTETKKTPKQEASKVKDEPKIEKSKTESAAVEEPTEELSEIVDTIKNDNNVVVFFSTEEEIDSDSVDETDEESEEEETAEQEEASEEESEAEENIVEEQIEEEIEEEGETETAEEEVANEEEGEKETAEEEIAEEEISEEQAPDEDTSDGTIDEVDAAEEEDDTQEPADESDEEPSNDDEETGEPEDIEETEEITEEEEITDAEEIPEAEEIEDPEEAEEAEEAEDPEETKETEEADDEASTGSWFFGSSEVEEETTDEIEQIDETDEESIDEDVDTEQIDEEVEEEEEEEESSEPEKSKLTESDINQLLDEKSEVIEELTKYIMAKILHENEDEIEAVKGKQIKSTISEEEEIDQEESVPSQEPENLSETATAVKQNRNVVIFFYETMDKISKKIINGLDKVEGSFLGKDIEFISVDIDEVPDIEISSVPSLIYFKNGEPNVYEENLMNEEAIREWVDEELKSNLDVIEDLNTEQIHDLMEENEYVMVYLYTADCEACDEAIKQLEQIDDDADSVGVKFVKTDEAEFAAEYGIDSFPAILYFENKQPSIYDGDAAEETELLTWLLYQMKEDTIENINRELLIKMIDEFEFLAVYFFEDNEDSVKVLRHLELIDDEAAQYGVRMVKLDDPLMSKKYGHRTPPGLGFFRKGNYIKFDGDLFDDEEMLDWLTDPSVMEISDQIEKVNKKMFEKLITRNEFLTVLFYSDTDCKQCDGVLQELENIDDDAETAGIPIVKLEDKELAKTVGVFALPAVVFFRSFGEEAVIYTGDLKREESILEWLMVQKDPSNDAIEELEGDELRKSVESSDAVAVFVYSHEECENCLETLTELENIDDDVERQKIQMLKTTDASFAEEVGVETYPALVFFKEGVPNLYEGDLTVEEEVLDWLTEMKVESHIELITRPMLETMVEETQYLAVFFYKQNCRTCDQVIAELENIDDECDMYGIQLVKLKDPPLAKRYGIKTFPALVYFRNGNPLTFDGDLKSEESVLEWLVDDDNRELEDEIEAVNFRMLDKLLETSPLMAVFFYDDECVECEAILEELETVDDEADAYGIDFVKNNDPHAARQYNIYNTPALVYFRRMSPVVFDGDLMDGERILEWLTSQDVFETKDEIEDVNRKMLEKLLDENEFVAVYFYEDNCLECDEAMEGLEKIDDETDALDITFVKVNDPRYAKKYGVNKLPALVYFRRKFPSIYRDSLFDEDKILEWLTSNRYKQLELGVFMYAIVSLAVTFICYTAFLMFGLKPREPEKKKEE